MNIVWTLEAVRDRAEISEYLALGDPQAAVRVDDLIGSAASRLAYKPLIGRPGRVTGTREVVVHEHYRLVYETRDDSLQILALVHLTRQWPSPRGA